MSLPQSGRAFVKQVVSADTVILRGRPVKGPPPERLLSFSNVTAPRQGSVKEPEKEEPHAFESRDYLRRLLVGKEVQYKIDYTTNTNARDFGVLTLHPSQAVNGETNVTKILVAGGYVKTKPDPKRQSGEDELVQLEEMARAGGQGLWGAETVGTQVKYTLEDEPRDFISKYGGKPLPAIVEQVRDGSTLRVALKLPTHYQTITLLLSGIKAPAFRKGVPGMEDLVEPFGEEAKYFVESRLLQRDVKVFLEGLNVNNFVGSVHHPNGNIAEALLSQGFAKVVDWTIATVTGGPGSLRAAEAKAKSERLRLWRDYAPKSDVNAKRGKPMEFTATVTKIISADMLTVTLNDGSERKITFSSVRGPKAKDAKEEPYNIEAREYLRSKLIGKEVKVNVEYVRPASDGFEERECGTVLLSGENIAVSLVSKGLAQVTKHRRDDEQRSSAYDTLLLAEDQAQKGQKGMFSPKDPPIVRIIDASENLAKAKQFLPFLQRSGNITAVIEFCASGSRFKVSIPSQNCKITLVLSGVRTGRTARQPNEKSEPFAQEALDFVNRYCLQRDVDVNIEGIDKVGGFVGSLFVQIKGKYQNVAATLLEEGFATLHEYSATQSPYHRDLFSAERSAKISRKGYWSIVDPATVEAEQVPVSSGSLKDEKIPQTTKQVIVSEITGGGKLYIQVVNDELRQLEKLMQEFSIHHSKGGPSAMNPKAGDYCSAQFAADNNWYRAKVKKVNPDRTVTVNYIDFGNTETLAIDRIRPLDPLFSVSKLAAQSTEVQLAYIKVPELESDYGVEAFEHLRQLTENKTLLFGEVGKDKQSGLQTILLVDPKDFSKSVQERMIRDGWATVDKKLRKRFESEQRNANPVDLAIEMKLANGHSRQEDTSVYGLVSNLLEAQDAARKSRLNLWQYGDFEDDEDM